MPTYFYTARSLKGERITGERAAKNKQELAGVLRKQGQILISADEQGQGSAKKSSPAAFFKKLQLVFDRVSLTDKMLFTRNLRVMIGAGIPLPRALKILAGQAKSKKFKQALAGATEDIIKGRSFSQGLARYPKIFSELFQNMVKVGEEAGTLEDALKILTRQMEREHQLKTRIKGAMTYPAVIIAAMTGIGILMLIVVVPKLADTFEELKIDLPLTTQLVIAAGNFLARFWYLIPVIALVLFIIFKLILSSGSGKRMIDAIVLKMPIISPIVRKTNSAYTARTLGSLIASGVPIVRALEILSNALSNCYFKRAIADSAEKVKKGAGLTESLRPHQIYPSLVIQMIEVGEETGETSKILGKLADFFEEEVANATKNMASIIEPVLMIIIGAAIGFFAISMLQPMYSMLGTL